MRKIKRISHLECEQRRLRHREMEIEKTIHNDWKEILQLFKPYSLAREAASACTTFVYRKLLKK